MTGATSYKIQISNSITGTTNCDPNIAAGTGFTTPIIEQVVSGTSFTPTTNLQMELSIGTSNQSAAP